ncbi:type II toxin-antitoxin system VapC family toxin [Nocardioides sp.]|uniref:type II toxin-antitoxin system VapC family toxin n=1 Tax=Nocardioides sp. TaxID=35761 RepID=UPI003511ABB6
MILVDSGPLIAAAIADDRDHRRCVDMFAALHLNSEKLLVPQTVVAEVAYAIQKQGGTDQELMFLQAFADADLALVDLVVEDLPRIIELVDSYRDFPLGTTDASVIAIAERLKVNEVATLDHRHFPNVRPRHVDYLTLLP